MKYDFDEHVVRRGTGSVKWDAGDFLIESKYAEKFDEETLPLFTADMDFAVPPCIVDAMHEVADQRIYGYTIPTDEYYEAIIQWFDKRHKWQINKEEMVFCPGTVNAVNIAVRALTEPGDGVIIQRPVYYPFTSVIEDNDRVVANSQMLVDEEGYYIADLKGFEEVAGKAENKLFVLCNPHNPSGRIFSKEDLRELSRICKENDVVIVADEIHGDLIRKDSVFTPLAKIVEDTSHIITCTAINKTFNVAGLHATSLVITDPDLRATYTKELGMQMPSPFTVKAVVAAYTKGEEWLEELKLYLDETIDWVMDFCREHLPKMKCVRPEGTYIFWMDFRDYGLSHEVIRKKIYVDANVVLESGVIFDPDLGHGFERICLSSPRAMVKEAFKRIAREFEGL